MKWMRYTPTIRPEVGDRVAFYVRRGLHAGEWQCGIVIEVHVSGRQPGAYCSVSFDSPSMIAGEEASVWDKHLQVYRNPRRRGEA